ncbi:PD40 domain-containing protein, partial [Candidatus Poribacteria bacterium]|nr:PD40 domain-containing protein [Candidatus Poribacteria bacterium]
MSPLGTWSYNPAWSPDGKWIAYDASDAEIANPPGNPNVVRHIFIVSFEGASHDKLHNIVEKTFHSHGFPKVFLRFSDCGHPDDPLGSV